MKRTSSFIKIMSLILIIGVLVTLPGFMVGVSADSVLHEFGDNPSTLDWNYGDVIYNEELTLYYAIGG